MDVATFPVLGGVGIRWAVWIRQLNFASVRITTKRAVGKQQFLVPIRSLQHSIPGAKRTLTRAGFTPASQSDLASPHVHVMVPCFVFL